MTPIEILNSRVFRRLHEMLDLADLTAMDAAILDETDLDDNMREIALALAQVATLVRQASDVLGPAHQALLVRIAKERMH